MKNPNRNVVIWLLTGCVLIFLMVIVGGITRLTHSGLSIVKWDLIIGTLPPVNPEQWNTAFKEYQASPEFRELNSHFTLSNFKSIYWWEYIHRLLGRFIGLVFILPLIWFKIKNQISKSLSVKLTLIFLLGALQGFLGWFMVESGLVNVPEVSHYRLALHLITAFITCGYTLWVAMELIYPVRDFQSAPQPLKRWYFVFFGVLIFQIIYGALVAGLKAGLVYNTFPLMGDSIIPADGFALDPFLVNFTENRALVQFIHRFLALFLLLSSCIIWLKAEKSKIGQRQRIVMKSIFLVTFIQAIVGVATLLLHVPVWMGVLHQAIAFMIFLLAVVGLFFIRERSNENYNLG